MFARLGSFAVRFRWFIIAAWIVAAVVITAVAPNIDEVAVSDQRAFLPSSAPSLYAHDTVAKYFPDQVSPSSAVLVIDAGPANTIDESPTADFIRNLTAWLTGPQAPSAIYEVWSPAQEDEQAKAALTSEDRQIALILVRFSAIGTEPPAEEAMAAIEEQLQHRPPGVHVYMTGDAPILGAYATSSQGSVDSTTWITIVLVVIILLVIYRSPVSPVIPLLTITLAYLISRGVVAFLGAHVLTISMYTNIFLIVVLFGAGTDYCLFLISRFREEMAYVTSPAPAVKTTVRAVGETIASSAGTVIVGLALMGATELGLYNTSGPSIAIGVAIALLAGLTFTPAMLTTLGHRAFWPRKAHLLRDSGFWHRWANGVVKRPLVALVVPLVVLIPLAVYGNGLERDFDMLGDLPKDNEARVGFDVLAEHLGPGTMQPLNVVVVDEAGFDTPQGLKRVEELEGILSAIEHVQTVHTLTSSLPDKTVLSVARQLDAQTSLVESLATQLRAVAAGGGTQAGSASAPSSGAVGEDAPSSSAAREGVAGGAAGEGVTGGAAGEGVTGGGAAGEGVTDSDLVASELESAVSGLVHLFGYLTQLAQAYPEVLDDPAYTQAIGALANLRELAGSLEAADTSTPWGPSASVVGELLLQLEALTAGLDSLHATFAARPEALLLPELYLQSNEDLKALHDAYISADGTAARLQVVLDTGPYTAEALATVQTIRDTLDQNGFSAAVEGISAIFLDLRDASTRDMTRAIAFVLGGVFVVLVLLLTALAAPIYLILTILLSYAATLGVVRLVFVDLLGAAGITWWVPLFMFVMLVALGMDYNIFLVGRVKEEAALNGTRAGVQAALARTGGIITSAGIIMAGTFASMLSSSLLGLLQIGFAVAFGVLLDTFVVRTALVPALTVLLGRWAWWPRRGPRKAGSTTTRD